MRPAPARSTYTVDFARRPAPRPTEATTGRVPRVVRLLALAHKVDDMIRAGKLKDLADAARACGVTRARMTQIMNLLLLAPEIQEQLLRWPPVTEGRDPVTERALRPVAAESAWERQRQVLTAQLIGRIAS